MIECMNGCGAMTQIPYEGVEIDVCGTCSGVWLDFGELTHIVETKEMSWSKEVIEKALASTGKQGVSAGEQNRSTACRICRGDLVPNNYQNSSGIIVNTCPEGHGLWLDSGELEKLQIYMEKWDEIAQKNEKMHQYVLHKIEADFERREHDRSRTGPSAFESINVFIRNIAKYLS